MTACNYLQTNGGADWITTSARSSAPRKSCAVPHDCIDSSAETTSKVAEVRETHLKEPSNFMQGKVPPAVSSKVTSLPVPISFQLLHYMRHSKLEGTHTQSLVLCSITQSISRALSFLRQQMQHALDRDLKRPFPAPNRRERNLHQADGRLWGPSRTRTLGHQRRCDLQETLEYL